MSAKLRSLKRREPGFNYSQYKQLILPLLFVSIFLLIVFLIGCMNETYLVSVQGGV